MSDNKSADAYKDFLQDIGDFSPAEKDRKKERPGGEGGKEAASVGERVRMVRKEKGLSLTDVSQRTGLDTDYLKQVETQTIAPPLGALIKIAKALDMQLGRFISTGAVKPSTIVRKDERRIISRFTSERGDQYGYTYESLAADKKDREMEPFIVTLTPSGAKEELSAHVGQEFIYVLQGELEVILHDQKDILYPGDSIYYDSKVPHLVRCHGDRETVILAVLYTKDT
jgi:transcriptional regulator with XRE-family HTH domain